MGRPVTKVMNEAYISEEMIMVSLGYLAGHKSQTDASRVLLKLLGRSPAEYRKSQTITNLAVIQALKHAVKLGLLKINNKQL